MTCYPFFSVQYHFAASLDQFFCIENLSLIIISNCVKTTITTVSKEAQKGSSIRILPLNLSTSEILINKVTMPKLNKF
jgi:hypothetical protein